MNLLKPTLSTLLLLYSSFIFSQAVISGELQKWHTVAITFDGPTTSESSATNPFLNYRLNVTFSSPSGETFLVPGFYAADGNAAETSSNSGNKWRVRFTPNEIGRWSYTASFRTGANVAISQDANAGTATSFNGKTGSFNIAASTKAKPDNRAKGRLSYVGERYLKFEEDDTYFLKAGSDSPENLLAYDDFDNTVPKKRWLSHAGDWQNGDPSWKGSKGKELIGAINYLSQKGMNAFSFLTMNVIGDGKDVWPWAATNHSELDGASGTDAQNRTRYDVSKLAQWEILFSHADTKGMYLHFKTQETENDQLLDGGELGIQRKLYYRELVARFGHHLALNWNLGEENDIYQELNDPQNTRVKSYASFVKSIDPYNHHIVIHSYPETHHQDKLFAPLLGSASELTGASLQIQIGNIHADVRKWVLASKNAGKKWVVANDEQGDHRTGVTADADYSGSKGIQADNRKDTRDKVLWGTLMAGGAGVEYYFGYQTGETDLTAQDFRSRDSKWTDAKIALDFFTDHLPFWEMETHDELTSSTLDYCFAKSNDTYAIYLPNGGSTNLNLSSASGSYTVKWFNPSRGGNLLNGSLTQINGGSTVSIGNPPYNTSSDWVALIRKGGTTEEDCNLSLNATTDFSNISVSGFSPAYIDGTRNALAINAALYKDKYAAAETIFSGDSGDYDIRLNTMTEIDGESSYRLKVDGNLVGSYINPTTTVDYAPAGKTFTNVRVNTGAVIRVEFNSNTNGKILEGSGTAFSRGRWTSLNFECSSDTPDTPDATDCNAYAEEKDGLVVIEAENLNLPSGWEYETAVNGFTGDGYLDWQGADSFSVPGNGIIATPIKINTPGTYRFQWRSKVGEGNNSTESNDSWLRFSDASDFYGQKGSSIVYPKGTGKTPNPAGSSSDGWLKVYSSGTTNWTWTTSTNDNNPHAIYVKFDAPGTYLMEISGRSKHHLIDRIVLSKNVSNATDLSLTETLCSGGVTETISVAGINVTPQQLSLEEGATTTLSYSVSPANATNKNATWRSNDETIATVDQNGKVTALRAGEVMISVTSADGGLVANGTITVTAPSVTTVPVTRIYVTPQQLSLEEGETATLSYSISPTNATNKNATWRSKDETLATVDQNGVVTALKAGTVRIEAISEDGSFRSDAVLTISSRVISVTGVAITPESASMEVGESVALSYVITPANASNKAVNWSSSDTSIAIVNNGVVSALKAGEVMISVTSSDGGIVANATITVTAPPVITVPVTRIYVTPQRLTLETGETSHLTYAISPSNASNKNATWRSKDEILATVDQNGVVTALKAGVVEVEAISEDGQFRSDATITIVKASTVPVTSIYVTPQRLTLEAGETSHLTYAISPSNASNKNATWRSKDETLATVDQNGVVTALKTGVVEVEAISEDGQFRSDATITIVKANTVPVTSIYVTPQSLTLEAGETSELTYAISPSNASNKNVAWRSKDETLATVDQNGVVTALRAGIVEVEAISEDGKFRSDAIITITNQSNRGSKMIVAYPNPTYDQVRIEGVQAGIALISVYRLNGTLLSQTTVKPNEDIVVSLARYPKGSYVIKILESKKTTIRRIMKK